MIDIENGMIVLCESGLVISSETTCEDLYKNIRSRILRVVEDGSLYTNWRCWLDIEDGRSIYAVFKFKMIGDGILEELHLHPQFSTTQIDRGPRDSDLIFDTEGVYNWHLSLVGSNIEAYRWGFALYFSGGDPTTVNAGTYMIFKRQDPHTIPPSETSL